MPGAAGLLLAAGAGRRIGSPKALLRDGSGQPFLTRAVEALRSGGCAPVVVVLGAQAEQARRLLVPSAVCAEDVVRAVVAPDWEQGMAASLRAGLSHLRDTDTDCALVSLVDLPDVGGSVVRRVLAGVEVRPRVLARASYAGLPGHPVLIGRDHWAPVTSTAHGDRGARDYLTEHPPVLVECGDLASGRDVDTAEDLWS